MRVAGKELIVPKIAGFENAALWVFGDHLIYTSPHNRMDRQGNLQSARTDFFRVNLDGSGHRLLYTTVNANLGRNNWTVAWAGGHSHLLVMDGGELVHIGVSRNPGRRTVIAEAATSVGMPNVTAYFQSQLDQNKGFGGVMAYVYWTQDRDEEDRDRGIRGNLLKRARLSDLNIEIIGDMVGAMYRVHGVSGGLFMWERNHVDEGRIMFAADNDNRALYGNAGVRGNFQALDIFEPSEQMRMTTERSAGNVFFTQHEQRLLRYVRNDNPDARGNRFRFDRVIAANVSEIILIGSNRIYYLDDTGAVRVIGFDGAAVESAGGMGESRVEGLRKSAFESVTIDGGRGMQFFMYMRTLTEVLDPIAPPTGEAMDEIPTEMPETITVPVLVDANGNRWILAVVDERFIAQ